jgi:hypothetical protein
VLQTVRGCECRGSGRAAEQGLEETAESQRRREVGNSTAPHFEQCPEQRRGEEREEEEIQLQHPPGFVGVFTWSSERANTVQLIHRISASCGIHVWLRYSAEDLVEHVSAAWTGVESCGGDIFTQREADYRLTLYRLMDKESFC